MNDSLWLLKPPYRLFIFGMFVLFLGVVYTCTGKAWVRFNGWVYRAKEPGRYWWAVATYYLGGLGLIGYFLYKIRAI